MKYEHLRKFTVLSFSPKGIVTAALLFVAGFLSAATLDVDVNVFTQGADRSARKQRDVVIFVLDRSSSMNDKAIQRSGQTRDKFLKEVLRTRIATLASTKPDAEIYTIQFASEITRPQGPFSPSDGRKILDLWNPDGCTLLYDALANAIRFGEDLSAKDPNVRVSIFVYTDGENYFRGRKWSGKHSGSPRSGNVEYGGTTTKEVNASAERFRRDFSGRFGISSAISLETGCWLGPGNPPALIENRRKDNYKLELSADGKELENPAAAPSQKTVVDLFLPIPPGHENELASYTAQVEFQANGKTSTGLVSLKTGRQTVRFSLPDNAPKGRFSGTLKITNLPDAWDDFSLSDPDPVEISFAAPGALSFLSVDPREDRFVKVGEAQHFSAKPPSGAVVSWKIGKESMSGESVSKTFSSAGDVPVEVRAEKSGFTPAVVSFTVHVVDASVTLSANPVKPKVGEPAEFKAVSAGKAERFSWSVDGQSVPGTGASLPGQSFERSGPHTIKVRALFGHGIFGEAECTVDVAVQPHIAIETPYVGDEYEFGAPIEAVANVEGDFDKVVWRLSGPESKTETVAIDGKEHVSKPVKFKPAKGGEYVLVATAEGKGASLESQPVKFSVQREDVMVRIDDPFSGSTAEIGSDLRLSASVKGDSITNVKWTVSQAGKTLFEKTVPVEGGKASCAYRPDVSIGNGTMLLATAEAAEDSSVRSEVDFVTGWAAGLEADGMFNGQKAVGSTLDFGSQVALVAKCSGVASPESVKWYSESDGKARELGSGPTCSVSEASGNKDLVAVNYYATASLPDGSILKSNRITVFFRCMPVTATVSIHPSGQSGEARSFGRNQKITFELADLKGDLSDIVWELGNGVEKQGRVVDFDGYSEYGEHTIRVSGVCPKCGVKYSFGGDRLAIEKQPPKAAFEIEEKGTYYTVKGKLHFHSTSTGDIDDYVWTVDGEELVDFRGSPDAEYVLPGKPCELDVKLQVSGPDASETSEHSRTVRVRYGWWAILVAIALAAFIASVAAKVLLHNEPAGWGSKTWGGPLPEKTEEGDRREEKKATQSLKKDMMRRYWNPWRKMAVIPMAKLDKKIAKRCASTAAIQISAKVGTGTPFVKAPGLLKDEKNFQGRVYCLIQPIDGFPKGEEPRGCRLVLDPTTSDSRYFWSFVLVVLALFAAVIWISIHWAI